MFPNDMEQGRRLSSWFHRFKLIGLSKRLLPYT
jgi:hypothetical protein